MFAAGNNLFRVVVLSLLSAIFIYRFSKGSMVRQHSYFIPLLFIRQIRKTKVPPFRSRMGGNDILRPQDLTRDIITPEMRVEIQLIKHLHIQTLWQ